MPCSNETATLDDMTYINETALLDSIFHGYKPIAIKHVGEIATLDCIFACKL